MNDLDNHAFRMLFREACEKCFGYPLIISLSETESKLFYNKIFEQTGLVVGWKSLKNYSVFITSGSATKSENPSVATMDTIARYVLNAPYISETERKGKESHYPFWFTYSEKFHRQLITGSPDREAITSRFPRHISRVVPITISIVFMGVLIFWLLKRGGHPQPFTDNFHQVSMSALSAAGWSVQNPDTLFWNRRAQQSGGLTLFTLRGDTWPNANEKVSVRNFLIRDLPAGCFNAEVHFSDFLPLENWQQAGVILMEDTLFSGKAIRLSIAYNDFFGGYTKPREIIIQAITSLGTTDGEPEEFVHQPILFPDSARLNKLLFQNITNISLRIEKRGNQFRFLYAGGAIPNPAFREVSTHSFYFHPRYIGLFALKGFVNQVSDIPVRFTFFRLSEVNCE